MTAPAEPQRPGGPPRFALRDVTLRDGLQLTGKLLPAARKIEIARALLALGVDSVEIGAMARPDKVPPMANTLEVISGLTPEEREKCWVWVATPRSAARALEAGARNLQYCFSASDAHNLANVGRTTEQSLAAMPEAVEAVRAAGARIQLTIATSFTCPFDGAIDPDRVIAIANDRRADGTDSIVICDTLGQATPGQVAALIGRVAAETPQERDIVFHGHDTWGLGAANALAAVGAGAGTVDGALGGLGGCPFAPGASGNTATEDILFALQPEWFTPATLASLVELSAGLLRDVGEPNQSRAAHAALATAGPFRWGLGS
ncbi:hydroxymethylglutaryl-CoA lyase [Paenarthrobacter sp. DKR-5]|uniref:hydroxymethylglutaryl-CoA lyase n=1 Tax=Paenarthrobacter sp. DKR-5 TaxID=2835535 RepID=UPI001BDBD207|nr:hydroxymethylglutaryl-CoA lyase [Paenarthrobacter sp. DKR-5]MBT1001550.1 hydroxymethylglutaryl-CoA lyase [Paenarthrobacter sp. DKR-5]